MKFSVGALYSAQEFLSFIFNNRVLAGEVRSSFRHFGLVSLADVLSLVQFSGWASIDIDGRMNVTDSGLAIVHAHDEPARLRLQLTDLILIASPPWIRLFPRGRDEVLPFLAADVQQCLREAYLTEGEDDAVVKWWDNIANLVRSDVQHENTETGREGERRSRNYEQTRTGTVPRWESLYSNNAGYDLLSRFSDDDATPLCIEVKASRQERNEARFFVSIGEWEIADDTEQYVFHLWLLGSAKLPTVVTVDEMRPHIPSNNGLGKWQQVLVPFSAFV